MTTWSKVRFCAALLVAAAFTEVMSSKGWQRVWRAFTLWFELLRKEPYVAPPVAAARLAACRACPCYYQPLRTCGSPLRRELDGIGCWCYVEAKAPLKGATCWLDDEAAKRGTLAAPGGWLYAVEQMPLGETHSRKLT